MNLHLDEPAWLDARRDGWSKEPVVEMLIPSTLDASLAPQGSHVASLFVQHVAPHLPAPRSWSDPKEKETFADLVIDTEHLDVEKSTRMLVEFVVANCRR